MAGTTNQTSCYTQGYSDQTVATHQLRTAESDAAFLIPHIKKTDRILDVGCGPGTITTGFAKYAREGTVLGIDVSNEVLAKAKAQAANANIPTEGPGSVSFAQGNVLEGLAYPDDTFDIIYCAQVLGHFPPPDLPHRALVEMRRVLKPGGILATRDAASQHFYPQKLDLDRLWVQNFGRVVRKGERDGEISGTMMPALFRKAGFDVDGGKVRIGTASTSYSGSETRKWLAKRTASQLQVGDPFRQSWLNAGISEDEIQQTVEAVQKWAETEDAWFAALHCEMLGWK